MSLATTQVIPIFRIFDVEKAKEFYVEYLGFKVDWEHRFEVNSPLYMQVSLGDFVLHLSEHYGDGCPGSTVFVKVTGFEDYHKELTAKNYKYDDHSAHASHSQISCLTSQLRLHRPAQRLSAFEPTEQKHGTRTEYAWKPRRKRPCWHTTILRWLHETVGDTLDSQ